MCIVLHADFQRNEAAILYTALEMHWREDESVLRYPSLWTERGLS